MTKPKRKLTSTQPDPALVAAALTGVCSSRSITMKAHQIAERAIDIAREAQRLLDGGERQSVQDFRGKVGTAAPASAQSEGKGRIPNVAKLG